jgi:uncharacterized transporter YbjL
MDDSDFTMAFAWRSFSIGIDKLIADARSSKKKLDVDLLTQARELAQTIMLGHENQNTSTAAVRNAEAALRDLEELQALRAENSALKEKVTTAEATSEPKNSHLLAIAGMLRLLKANPPKRYTQDSIASEIEEYGWSGASHSGLTKLFAEANRAARDAESNAKA